MAEHPVEPNAETHPCGTPGPDRYEPVQQTFAVPFHYPVHFDRNVFADGHPLLPAVMDRLNEGRRHRAAVYIDDGVAAAHPDLIGAINRFFHTNAGRLELAAPPQVVPGGEQAKTQWGTVREVMWTIGNLHLDRQSFVIAIGGGSMLDVAGFATSIVHRGLRLIRLPTTTLAQCDAGVGVKNGMDEHGAKNFVGTFAPPFAVINDFAFLATLAEPEWGGGIAEAFKVAIIKDRDFFDFLSGHAQALRQRNEAAMEHTVYRCAVLHLEHIRTSGDPFEFGSARPLDFGHWSAHKLECLSGYTLGHGRAVAIGIALDSCYACREGLLSASECDRILTSMQTCGLPIWDELLASRTAAGELAVLGGLSQFREHLGGTLTVTLPQGIGHRVEVHHMNPGLVEEAVAELAKRHAKTCD